MYINKKKVHKEHNDYFHQGKTFYGYMKTFPQIILNMLK